MRNIPGDHNEKATPGPIPNPEVKLFGADDTALATEWESRSSPGFLFFDFHQFSGIQKASNFRFLFNIFPKAKKNNSMFENH
jgi:hypothetical protein